MKNIEAPGEQVYQSLPHTPQELHFRGTPRTSSQLLLVLGFPEGLGKVSALGLKSGQPWQKEGQGVWQAP